MDEDDIMDLAYETPEGDSDFADFADGIDDFDDVGEDDDLFLEMADGDFLDAYEGDEDFENLEDDMGDFEEDDYYEDSFELEDDDDFDTEADDDFDENMASALASEDEDEFFKKLWKGIKRVGKKVGRVVKKVAPHVARIASFIPHPAAQAIGGAARLISRLRAESEDTTDALEMAAEAAKRVPAATPVVVGLIGKKMVGRKGKMISRPARKAVAKNVRKGLTKLNKKCGSSGAQVAAQVAKRVVRKMPAASPVKKAKVFRAAASKIARRPRTAKMLAKRASVRSKLKARKLVVPAVVSGAGGIGGRKRTMTVRGPARITVTQA